MVKEDLQRLTTSHNTTISKFTTLCDKSHTVVLQLHFLNKLEGNAYGISHHIRQIQILFSRSIG